VVGWLAPQPQHWLDQVQYVAIDMCTVVHLRGTPRLPGAILVVDHFHVMQLANKTLCEVRRRITSQR
jgi:transposase